MTVRRNDAGKSTLQDILAFRASETPSAPAYHFLSDGLEVTHSLTYSELHQRALGWKQAIERSDPQSRHVTLTFAPGLEFLEAFFGCLYAGKTAIPAYPPTRRGRERFLHINSVCDTATILTDPRTLINLRRVLGAEAERFQFICEPGELAAGFIPTVAPAADNAFIQFTSGTTNTPKGVLVTQQNILSNQEAIRCCFGTDETSRILGWLPMYHDMGLIGVALHPLYAGAPCWVMAPAQFASDPLAWLDAISRFRITISGGPNFAYDLCSAKAEDPRYSGLDLRSWKVAFNGSEPVSADTLDRFTEKFSPRGFHRASFLPCYGLAEATLFVAGKRHDSSPLSTTIDADQLAREGRMAIMSEGKRLVSCGAAAPGFQVRIVDPEANTECLEGMQGEIWISGPSVAAGYYRADPQDDEGFSGRLGNCDGPYLRTGDLGVLNEGQLYITGRHSDLIIVRGRNIYPQDLEHTAQEVAAVVIGGVAAFQDEEGGEAGVGLLVEISNDARDRWPQCANLISESITATYGVAVLRVGILRHGLLPRTSSGKVRRKYSRQLLEDNSLPLLGLKRRSELPNPEKNLASKTLALIAQAAKTSPERIRPADTLYTLGLDSLAIIQLQGDLRRVLGVDIAVDSLLDECAVRDLLNLVSSLSTENSRTEASLPAKNPASLETAPQVVLSNYQKRFLVLDEIREDGATFTVAAQLRLRGPLDSQLLLRSLRATVRRHDALWLRVGVNGDVLGDSLVPPDQIQLDGLDPATSPQDFFARAFDLARGPLYRFGLLSVADDDHRVLITFHHIVADGWSMRVFIRDLMAYYKAGLNFEQPDLPPPVSYRTFTQWQSNLDKGPALGRLQRRLEGAPAHLPLPVDPDNSGEQAGALEALVPADLSRAMNDLAVQENTSRATVWLAAFSLLLARLSDQSDLVIGSPAVTREFDGSVDAVGLYLNLIPVRIKISADTGLAAHIQNTDTAISEARRDRHVPLEDVLEMLGAQRDPHRAPLFQTLFNYLSDVHFGGAIDRLTYELEPVLDIGAKFDITLYVAENAEGNATLHFSFDRRKFSRERMTIFADQLLSLASQFCSSGNGRAWTVPLRDTGRCATTVTPNPWLESIDERVRSLAGQPETRHAPALISAGGTLSYSELDCLGNGLAKRLLEMGVRRGNVVVIIAERTASLPWAILGILRAGAVFSVIDASYPQARIAQMVSVAAPAALLFCLSNPRRSAHFPQFGDFPVVVVPAMANKEDTAAFQLASLATPPKQAGDAACLTFTSGSGGKPEAVLGSHGGLTAFLPWQTLSFHLDRHDRFSLLSGLSHDPLQRDIFTAWWAGACVVVPPSDIREHATEMADWLAIHKVSVANLTPSLARMLVLGHPGKPSLASLRLIFLVGEALYPADVVALRRVAPDAEIVNLYGATETQRALTHLHIPSDAALPHRFPLGLAPPGMSVEVLRANGDLADIGELGEICVSSPHLALGYFDPQSTRRENFRFHAQAGRQYCTGDRGWYTTSGQIWFAGRSDRQVNVAGYRVELADIESAVNRVPGVLSARAKWRPESSQLTLYFVADPARQIADEDQEELRVLKQLSMQLPSHMVPQRALRLTHLPLTPNGKLDDAALPQPTLRTARTAPATPTEQELARIWAKVLGHDDISREDSFIGLGGHSIKALQLQAEILERFKTKAPLTGLLNASSLQEMAVLVDSTSHESEDIPVVVPDPKSLHLPFPLNDIQRAYLVGRQAAMTQGVIGSQSYYEYESEDFDPERFESAWNQVVAMHPMLRAMVTDDWQQRILPEVPHYRIPVHDWRGYSDQEQENATQALRERMTSCSFDPAQWPLFRIEACRRRGQTIRLHFSLDFMVADAWSWSILLPDLNRCYSGNQPDPAAATALSFRDYILAEHAWRAGESVKRSLEFWRDRMRQLPPAPQLPVAIAPEQVKTPRFTRQSRRLSAAQWTRFKRNAALAGVTPTAAVVSIFGSVVAYWNPSPRFTLNLTLFDRRPWHPDIMRLVGDFTSVLLMPMDFTEARTVQAVVKAVQATLLENLDHRGVSGVQVMRELNAQQAADGGLRVMPIVFTSKLGLRDAQNPLKFPAWLGQQFYGVSQTPQVWLDSQASEEPDGSLSLNWDLIESLFEPQPRAIFPAASCTTQC